MSFSPRSPVTPGSHNDPVTPESQFRSRRTFPSSLHVAGEYTQSSDNSPTSSTFSTSSSTRQADPLTSSLTRPSFRTSTMLPFSTPPGPFGGKLIIRSDPSLVTCFDPADKELYALWAPKK
ncbi:hypothetical protein JAAARDRAFT_52515 [Jaapia argillacea MUCL 33604]|uniref:Uncharacterized protein n=1 Tax=Jaapia argillacea MUCL 33604 TaxID=933084 RepID=A0A067QEG7_9AGAM|nr:hypothetical protein JAAARDRAFT_52515 [Jaapia argillacea MUCL 33604]